MGSDVVAEQAARAKLDVREAGGVEPASTTFANVNSSLRSGLPDLHRKVYRFGVFIRASSQSCYAWGVTSLSANREEVE
jgi:hypothetical protein